nr:hypothetical protein [Tanacetum cinerariifolium]
MLLCKQEEAGFQLNVEQADWRDDTNDEPDDQELEAHYMSKDETPEVLIDFLRLVQRGLHAQELEAHYMYMAQNQEFTLDAADNFGPIFDFEPLQKQKPNKFLETSNKVLVDKLQGQINDFKTKNKSLESSNNHFKEADNELSKTNQLMYKDLKKFQAELDRYHDVKYASKVEIDYVKAKGDLMSYKMEFEKSSNEYTQKINDLNQTISKMKKELFAHQETISIMSKQKEAQIKFYKTCEDKEIDKVIALENKVKVLDNIVYKTGQTVQTMNMLNRNCKMSFAKPEFLKKAQRANPRLSQLEAQKTQFLNEIDRLSREYYYADHMNAIFGVYTKLDEVTNLQCGYLELLEKCECLENELSKSKMMSKSFEAVQKHAINLELELQQYLKALLQDNGIVISELKKLIEKLKGKSVNTKIEKSSVIRQPNTFKSQRPSIFGKPTTFSNSFERKDFSKSKSVTQNNVSNNFSKPVTAQTLPPNQKSILKNTNVLAPGMYKLHTESNQARTSQLPQDSRKTNKRVSFSTGVIPTTSVSRPQLKRNQIGDRVILKARTLNVNIVSAMCDKCVLNDKHDMCVLNSVAKPLKKTVASASIQKPRNIIRKIYERFRKACSWWYPKFTPSGYKWKPKFGQENVNLNVSIPLGSVSRTANTLEQIVLFIVDSGCSKHMTGNLKLLINFVEKFLGTVKFGNDQIAPILGYGDLVQGAVTIKRVYYVEGLNHNLFSVGQFCDANLEVAFWKSTCYICDLKGTDLLTGSRGKDLYSIKLQDTNCPNPICLMAKASSSQALLWHRRLSHLNFDTINLLSKNDIVVGLPKLKFFKDHLCSF